MLKAHFSDIVSIPRREPTVQNTRSSIFEENRRSIVNLVRSRPNRERIQEEPIIISSYDNDRDRRDHTNNSERNQDHDMDMILNEPPAKRNRTQQPVIIDRTEFNSNNSMNDFSTEDIQMPSIVRNQSRPSSRDQANVPVIVDSKNGRNHANQSKKTQETHHQDQKCKLTENARVNENPDTPKWATEDQSGRNSGHEVDKIFRELNEGLEDRSEVTSEDLDSCLIIGERTRVSSNNLRLIQSSRN